MSLSGWFSGPSLLDGNGLYIAGGDRLLNVGDMVDSYRNLCRPNSFSVKSRQGQFKGLVTGYGRSVVIAAPTLIVGEKARLRVVQERCKNVHSYVRGRLVGVFDGDLTSEQIKRAVRISYSPYAGPSFFQLERDTAGRPIDGSIAPIPPSVLQQAEFAVLNGSDVFLI